MVNNNNMWQHELFPPGAGEREGGFCHLGNITHKVNTSNAVVPEYNFDAWGRRRNPTDWSYNVSGQLFADRGFTGHEYLPWYNLYNMNGRLYDPLVGRFLNADPYIQDAGFTQSYNRYSYCLNNPLKYTDPTGEKWYHWFAVLNPISYLQGAYKHNWTWNPEKWDWSQAFFRIGVKTENHGLQVYLGYGWDPNFVPTFNYDTGKGAGAGVSGANGNNGAYFPGYNPPTAEEVVLKKINEVRQVYGQAWHASSSGISNWASNVDWAGVTNASLNVLGGAGEMIVGGAGEYFSAGTASPVCVPLLVDGGYRTATNFSRLVGYLTLNNGFANAMPSNIGATIGKGIDMLSGVPIDGYGYGQGFGGATNDFISFIYTGGTAGSMSNMVSNPTLGNGIWYMSAYGGYTNSLFYDFYPLKK